MNVGDNEVLKAHQQVDKINEEVAYTHTNMCAMCVCA